MDKKRLFLLISLLFFGAMIYVGYDISTRTTFPGSRPQLPERLFNRADEQERDTIKSDSVNKEQLNAH